MQRDGHLSKLLGDVDPVPGVKTSEQAAALLAADDRVRHAPSRSRGYSCERTRRLEPNGSPSASRAMGEVCLAYYRVSRIEVQRYVEFAADGTAVRDYLVHQP